MSNMNSRYIAGGGKSAYLPEKNERKRSEEGRSRGRGMSGGDRKKKPEKKTFGSGAATQPESHNVAQHFNPERERTNDSRKKEGSWAWRMGTST